LTSGKYLLYILIDERNAITLAYEDFMEKEQLREITKRLDVLIGLVIQNVQREGKNVNIRGQIQILSGLGLRPAEIAGVLGKSNTFVNKELTLLRRSR
jgi:hypothetical protein